MTQAQSTEIDSLENLLKTYTLDDTLRVNFLNKIAVKLPSKNVDKSIQYANTAIELANQLNYKKGKAESLKILGDSYRSTDEYPEALNSYQNSLHLFKELGYKKEISDCFYGMGYTYRIQGNYQKALEAYQNALQLREQFGDKKGVSYCYNGIGLIYENQGDYPKALDVYQKALKIREELGDKRGISGTLNNIGVIYRNQENFTKALEYYEKSLKIKEEIGYKRGISSTLTNIGFVYVEQGDLSKALEYFQKSLQIREEIGYKRGISSSLSSIGNIYRNQGEYDKAIEYLQKAIKISGDIGAKDRISTASFRLGDVHLKKGELSEAQYHAQKSYDIANEIGNLGNINNASGILANVYNEIGDYQKAYNYHIIFKQSADSLINEENTKKLTQLQTEFKFQKEIDSINLAQEKERLAYQVEIADNQRNLQIVILGLILSLVLGGVLFRFYKSKQKANKALSLKNAKILEQKEELSIQAEELITQRDNIEISNRVLAQKNKQIQDSIFAAKVIQNAVFSVQQKLKEHLDDFFLVYKPKDIVSGDFYWISQLGDTFWVMIADCTGHGVPGAFMTLLGNSLLDKLININRLESPAKVLDALHQELGILLQQSAEQGYHGMDCVLLKTQKSNDEQVLLTFAGAKNSFFYRLPNSTDLMEVKGTRASIGRSNHLKKITYENHTFSFPKGTLIFAGSDGFQDQNDIHRKSFGKKRLKSIIQENSNHSLSKQKDALEKVLEEHMKGTVLRDDILFMGLKL